MKLKLDPPDKAFLACILLVTACCVALTVVGMSQGC